jgi:hypothetical protein
MYQIYTLSHKLVSGTFACDLKDEMLFELCLEQASEVSYSFFWTSIQSGLCSVQRVTLRTGRDLRGACGAMTTDCPFNLALLTEPHVEHCTSWTVDSSQRAASSLIGPEKEQWAASPSCCTVPT